jgi:hypothetical protein
MLHMQHTMQASQRRRRDHPYHHKSRPELRLIRLEANAGHNCAPTNMQITAHKVQLQEPTELLPSSDALQPHWQEFLKTKNMCLQAIELTQSSASACGLH